jgi:hypothetical protein
MKSLNIPSSSMSSDKKSLADKTQKIKYPMTQADINGAGKDYFIDNQDIKSDKPEKKSSQDKALKVTRSIIGIGAVINMALWSHIYNTTKSESNKVTEYLNNNYHLKGTPEQIRQINKIDTQKIHDTMKECNIARSQKPSNVSDIERVPTEQLNMLDQSVLGKLHELTIIQSQGNTQNMIPEEESIEGVTKKLIALQQKTGIKLTANNLSDGVKKTNQKLVKISEFYNMLERNFNIAHAFGVDNRYTTFNLTEVDELSGGSHNSDYNLGKKNQKHALINIAPGDINLSGNYHEILGHLDSDIQSPDANMCLLITQMQANGASYEESIELLNELTNYQVPNINKMDQEKFLKDPSTAYQQEIRNAVFYNSPKDKNYNPNTVPEKLKKFGVEPYQYNNIFVLSTNKGVVDTAKHLIEFNQENPQIIAKLEAIIKKYTTSNIPAKLLNIASYPEIESVATEKLAKFGIGALSNQKSLLHYNVMLKIAAKTNNGAYLDLEYFKLLGRFNWEPNQKNSDKMNQYLIEYAKPLKMDEVMKVDSKYISDLKNVEFRS